MTLPTLKHVTRKIMASICSAMAAMAPQQGHAEENQVLYHVRHCKTRRALNEKEFADLKSRVQRGEISKKDFYVENVEVVRNN
jgi:hypothetical protein